MPNGDCPANIDECPHLERSAELAVKKVFAILGVNIDDPEKVEEFRVNLRFSANLRRNVDRGIFGFTLLCASGIGVALWEGIKSMMASGPK